MKTRQSVPAPAGAECRAINPSRVTERTARVGHVACSQERLSLRKERGMENDRKDGVEGEGSYSGTKDYNQRTEKFVKSGKVDQAAHDAEPKSEEEKQAMQEAERIGKQRAKK
jgi:hypothetical protein